MMNEAAFDLEENHFARQEDPHRFDLGQNDLNSGYELLNHHGVVGPHLSNGVGGINQQQTFEKVLLFWKQKERNEGESWKILKKKIEVETENFLVEELQIL